MKKGISSIVLLILLAAPLSGFEQTLILGEEDGWTNLSRLDNLQIVPGHRGYPDLTLRDGEYRGDSATDLLLHFNREPVLPASKAYRIIRSGSEGGGAVTTAEKVLGSGSAAFSALAQGLEWEPAPETLLGAGTNPGDFTLEFWLYPTQMADGEEVFSWEGMQITGGMIRPQGIHGRIFNQKLRWEFSNFFQTAEEEPTIFTLKGLTSLLPRRWHHHMIRYESRTGLLEYLVNGEPEAVIHTTPTGGEAAEVYAPRCGGAQPPRITLGRSYLGLVEELRLSKAYITEPQLTRFTLDPGTARTRVLDLGQPGARFLGMESRETNRGSSAITYAYRQSDTIFRADDPETAWQILSPGEAISQEGRGRYLQLEMTLMPDGSGYNAPQLSSIKLTYEVALPPLPPTGITVEPGNGEVTLRWNRLGNATTRGYKLYFGTRPGLYFGSAGEDLSSPIDIGDRDQYTLKGLENGTLYYFALTAYGGHQGKLSSEYSEERSARPGNDRSEAP